jgi:hypothetical protein
MYIESVLAPWYAVDGRMGTPYYTDTPLEVKVDFLKIRGRPETKCFCNVKVEAPSHRRLHPTSTSYI